MLPKVVFVLTDAASPVGRQERHFYFFLFLLSRKARNAITKLPKDISKPIIPINVNMISAAVITTHRLRSASVLAKRMSTGHPATFLCTPVAWYKLGRLPPRHGYSYACFHAYLEYHIMCSYSIETEHLFFCFIKTF